MTIIADGTGSGNRSRVSGNRLFVHSVTEQETLNSTLRGEAYNINTGTIALTSSTASGVLYLKNNEDKDLIITAIAVGLGSAGTTTDSAIISVIKNPTTGTLISTATNVDMNVNRNFGSSRALNATAYKGAEGRTVTNGTQAALFYQAKGGRLFADLGLVLSKGDSIAVTVDTNTTTGTTNVYAAFVCELKNEGYSDK